jgi:hypothetical protein
MAETRVLMGYDALFSMNQALYELRDIVGTRPINPETLHELDRRLALLDQHFPEGASRPLANLLSFGEELLENDRREGGWNLRSPDGPERRWRTFYSARLQAATVFEAADRLAMQAAALETESWAVAGPRIQSIEQEMRDFPDSRLRYGIINITSAQFTRRTRSLLRLIHVGTHYRATGESSTLDDPVGDVLQTRLTDDSFMAWSRSPSSGEELPPRKGIRVYESNANITVPLRK